MTDVLGKDVEEELRKLPAEERQRWARCDYNTSLDKFVVADLADNCRNT